MRSHEREDEPGDAGAVPGRQGCPQYAFIYLCYQVKPPLSRNGPRGQKKKQTRTRTSNRKVAPKIPDSDKVDQLMTSNNDESNVLLYSEMKSVDINTLILFKPDAALAIPVFEQAFVQQKRISLLRCSSIRVSEETLAVRVS